MGRNNLVFRMLILTIVLFSVKALHAQRPDNRSFEHLWTLYDGIKPYYVKDQRSMLDTIAWKAEAEHNAYNLFIVNYKRMMLDFLYQDKSNQQTVMLLDSLRRDNAASRWGDRDSTLYQSLYHYLIGKLLYPSRPVNAAATTLQEPTFRNMEEWSAENYREVAKEQFFVCFDIMPRDVTILTHRWDFLLSNVPETRFLRPTLNDVLYQGCVKQVGNDDPELAIALIDEAMAAHKERDILIDYEIQRLHYAYPKVDDQVDSSACWKKLDSLESIYGPDLAFDYERGVLLAAADQIADRNTGYKQRAQACFDKVLKQCGTKPYANAVLEMYAQNAAYYLEALTLPSISLYEAHTDLTLGHKLRVPVQYRNLETLYVSVYSTSPVESNIFENDDNSECWSAHILKNSDLFTKTPLLRQRFDLDSEGQSRFSTTELWIDSLPAGNYLFCFHTRPELDEESVIMTAKFRVTRLKIANWSGGLKKFVAVNDRRTGEPLRMKRVKTNYPHTLYTNRFGEMRYSDNIFGFFWFSDFITVLDNKEAYEVREAVGSSARYRYHRYRGFYTRYYPHLFTDRTLYRPGHTVHFKYILSKNGKAKKNMPLIAVLKGDKATTSDTLWLTTSEYGSVSGEFQLPREVGKYTLSVKQQEVRKRGRRNRRVWPESVRIEVAEYKLPTFKVKLQPDSQQVAAGDTLTIHGTVTALNGLPIANAAVAIQVQARGESRNSQFEVFTERDGRFEYRYPVGPFSYMLDVEAIVTDLNGETHSDKNSVWISDKLLRISISKNNDVDLSIDDTARWLVKAVNYLNVKQPVPLRVSVVRLQSPEEYRIPAFKKTPSYWRPLHSEEEYAREFPHLTFDPHANDPNRWKVLDTVYKSEEILVPDSILKISVNSWNTGNYKLLVEGVDKAGKTVSAVQQFTVNRSEDSDFRTYQPIRAVFTSVPETTGKPLTISVGSCLRNAVMICDVYQGGRRLKTLQIPLDRGQKTVSVKTRKNSKRALSFCARIVKDDQLYKVTCDTVIPLSQKDREHLYKLYRKLVLNVDLTHYRDVTEPGSKEHWVMTFTDGKGKAFRQAELLAWMIDGSLHELGMHRVDYGKDYYPQKIRVSNKYFDPHYPPSQCFDLSDTYSDYYRYNKGKAKKTTLLYESVQPFLYTFSNSNSDNIDAVVVAWEPPVFSADNTASGNSSELAKALADMEGVSATGGAMAPVRGNRSDGQQTIVDGVRVSPSSGAGDGFPETDTVMDVTLSPDVTPRSNFVETAFFYPNLHPDDSGRVYLDFTLPDQYTGWEFYAFGHGKNMRLGRVTALLQSRRTLMLQSNAPRFLREGNTLTLRAKVTNRSESDLDGSVTVEFFDAETNQPVNVLVAGRDGARPVSTDVTNSNHSNSTEPFHIPAGASQMVQFSIFVPNSVSAIGYRMVARAGNFGDGEERLLPVLPNKMLVTESCPFVVPANSDTALTFSRFRLDGTPTMQPLSYTMEVTTNPAWLAIRALPYLMRYPYDCNEQTFSKLFAAATVQHAIAQNPGLDMVFRSWLADTLHDATVSPLLKNESLHTMLLEETPWLRDAQNESRQRKETAELFVAENLQKQLDKSLNKLIHNQLTSGGWDWYGHYNYSRYITDHLIAGFYKLQRMGVEISQADKMLEKAIRKSDQIHEEDYQRHLKRRETYPEVQFFFTEEDIHYLYARSFAPYDSVWLLKPYVQNLMSFMTEDLMRAKFTRMAEVALILYRTGDKYGKLEAQKIMEYIRQQAVIDREKGMYWRKEHSGCYYRWYEAPIERQALLIEAFTEISPRQDELTAMKQWLLLQKESNSWNSTKATAEAVYALLLGAPSNLLQPAATTVRVGETVITEAPAEAGTGYLQRVWNQEDMLPELANITVRTDATHPAFGAAYYQYLEVPDKVEASGSGLTVRRTLYHQPAVGDGHTAAPVTDENPVRLGERITVKIVISSDRDLEYVQVKDPRAVAFEPVNIHEREGWQNGVRWVESPRDASVCFFFDRFPQGTVVLEYDVFATQTGDFSNGTTTVECMYAPEYRAQGAGVRVKVR
jgi:hypothetical protein